MKKNLARVIPCKNKNRKRSSEVSSTGRFEIVELLSEDYKRDFTARFTSFELCQLRPRDCTAIHLFIVGFLRAGIGSLRSSSTVNGACR